MNTMAGPTQSALFVPSFLVKPPVEIHPDELKNDPSPNRRPSLSKRATLAIASHLIFFFTGVAAILAWQIYSDVARHRIARDASTPDQQQFNAISLGLDEVRRSIGGLAISIGTGVASSQEQTRASVDQLAARSEQTTRSIDQLATRSEQTTRSIDQLAARLEQMAREIAKLQAVEQYVFYKSSEPPPRPALAQMPNYKPVPRPPQAPIMR